MRSAARLFEIFGNSPTNVGRAIGVSKQVALHWKVRGYIPVAYAAKVETVTSGLITQAAIVFEHQMRAIEAAEKRRSQGWRRRKAA